MEVRNRRSWSARQISRLISPRRDSPPCVSGDSSFRALRRGWAIGDWGFEAAGTKRTQFAGIGDCRLGIRGRRRQTNPICAAPRGAGDVKRNQFRLFLGENGGRVGKQSQSCPVSHEGARRRREIRGTRHETRNEFEEERVEGRKTQNKANLGGRVRQTNPICAGWGHLPGGVAVCNGRWRRV